MPGTNDNIEAVLGYLHILKADMKDENFADISSYWHKFGTKGQTDRQTD